MSFRVLNSLIGIKWIWRDAHGDSVDGVFVTGGWRIRNFTLRYILPPETPNSDLLNTPPKVLGFIGCESGHVIFFAH